VQDGDQEAPRASRLPAAAALLAASVLFSRLLGYARDALLANRVGVGTDADAYNAAFQIPDFLNYLLAGGALSIAFLPFYTRLRSQGDEAAAQRFQATVLGTLGVVALLATALLWGWAESLVAFCFRGFDAEAQALTVRLTRIVLPAQVFFVTGGILQASLLARGRFLAQALAPLLYNGAIIAGGFFAAPRIGVEGFSWGALIGALLGPFLVPLLDAWRRMPIRVRVAPLDRDFLRYLAIAAPLMFGVTLLTVDEWYDRLIGSLLGEGAVAQLGYGRRLMLLPVAVVGQAIGAAAFPTLAHLWAERRRAELDRVLETTLRTGVALAVLAGAASCALARPLVEFVYHHGAFTTADAAHVSLLLRLFAFAVPAWVAQQIVVRSFYARGDTWRPMLLGTAVALAMIPLYLLLGRRFDVPGIALAGVLGMSVNALVTLIAAHRLHDAPRPSTWIAGLARALAIAVPAAVAASAVIRGRVGVSGALLDLWLGGLAFGVVAAAGILVFGDAPLRAALLQLLQRLLRRPGAA
jgi:putative peptidoglycan lipid II flippase